MTSTAKLKAAAEKARWGDWSAYKPHSGARGYEVRVGIEAVAQHCLKDDAAFIAEASPKAVLELIAALEAAEKRNAELEAVKNWWKPERCPVTNRPFFLWIEHPSDGMVPTYGGPFDSYTIPTVDSDGEFCCERYDHDVGAWVDSECLSVRLTGGEA